MRVFGNCGPTACRWRQPCNGDGCGAASSDIGQHCCMHSDVSLWVMPRRQAQAVRFDDQ
jgi:hypothetical protein